MYRLLLLILLISPSIFCKDYSNYKVYDVTPTKNQVHHLREWENRDGIDFWSSLRVGHPARIMVSPDEEKSFKTFLENFSIANELTIPDVEAVLSKEKADRVKSQRTRRSVKFDSIEDVTFDHFWTFDEMESYAHLINETYPNIVSMDILGKSIEGRNMFGLKISNNLSSFGEKPIIFIDAGTHAREWASQPCALYLIHQLTTSQYSQELLGKTDWVVVPNVNPDGYVYTHTTDRLWRRNRRFVNSTCSGIDLNRNYAYQWAERPNSCGTDGYPGAWALSEPETAAVSEYMKHFSHNLGLYVATHSYGPLVLWPFGFDFNVYISNWKEHDKVGKLFVDAVSGAGNTDDWEVGNSADILYTANGASDDFAIAYGRAKLAYTVELPPGPTHVGFSGFEYPEDMIDTLVKEIFMGYRAMGLYIGETYYHGN